MRLVKPASDLRRVHSIALDDVVGYCNEVSLKGKKPVDVVVKREEEKECTDSDASQVPVSYEVSLVYIVSREDMPDHPIERKEAVLDLCFSQEYPGLDNPPFRTSSATVVSELNLQIAARLARLLQLKENDGVVKTLTYHPKPQTPVEVTEEFLRRLVCGEEIPSEAYKISDDFRRGR